LFSFVRISVKSSENLEQLLVTIKHIMQYTTTNTRTIGSLVDQDKSVKELKALRRNWEDTLIREYDVLTDATKTLLKLKIDEVKELIKLKQS